jgi:hypothetical protein
VFVKWVCLPALHIFYAKKVGKTPVFIAGLQFASVIFTMWVTANVMSSVCRVVDCFTNGLAVQFVSCIDEFAYAFVIKVQTDFPSRRSDKNIAIGDVEPSHGLAFCRKKYRGKTYGPLLEYTAGGQYYDFLRSVLRVLSYLGFVVGPIVFLFHPR